MSTSKAAIKATKNKQSAGGDAKGAAPTKKKKKANNVAVGTLGQDKGADDPAEDDDRNYVYRDFSQIYEEDFDVDYEIDQEVLLQVSFTERCLRIVRY